MRHLCFVVLIFTACSGSTKPRELTSGQTVVVTDIIKGDEVSLQMGNAKTRFRLMGVHAFSAVVADPQVQALSAGGEAALAEIVKGKEAVIQLDLVQKDSSGRYLGYLSVADVDVGKKLIEQGWALAYTEFPFQREADYLAAEQTAKSSQKGLWGIAAAVPVAESLKKQWQEARAANAR